MEWLKGEFVVTCDPQKLNLDVVAGFLGQSYWAKSIPPALVRKAIENSLNFSLLKGEEQIGFARVVSDFATFGYLSDVFVLPEYRRLGLGKWMMNCVLLHPDLQGLRRWMLATLDAHALYEQIGFNHLAKPEMIMEKVKAVPYPLQ